MRLVLATVMCAVSLAVMAKPIQKADEARLKAAMDDRLFDSESARLKNVGIFESKDGGEIVCGTVNAKNRYGAYVGYTPFMAMKLDSGEYYVLGISAAAGQVCNDSKK